MHDLKTHWFSNVLNNFKCDLSAKEKELLKRVGRDVSIGCIVAIGPNSRNIETELSCVNTEDGKDYNKLKVFYFEQKMYSKSDRDLYYQGESFDTPHCISRIILSSEEATFFWREPIGMLFLSGDHSYDQLKRDIDQWEPFVVPSGLIVIHEGKKGGDDTRNVIEEVISTKKYIRYDNIGKTNVLKKVFVTHPNDIPPLPRMRLLIACNDMVPAGGLLRFQRAGSVMERWGHKVCFVVLSDAPKPKIKSEFPVISFERAKKLEWDAVMVPGAGFTVRSREKLADLKKENFGVRIQHILNDQSRLERFKLINEIFSPNIVIFNNTHWPIGSFTRFRADRFHFLIGAVDPRVFRPMTYRTHPLTPKCWVVGGLAPKNPDPLVESLAHLPETVCIRMFGIDRLKISQRYKKYFNQGRLELVGILNEQELQNFYHAADCIVMTEKNAGWANMVAEAMASGVPVICTPHGTSAFARHNENALVIDTPTPPAIAENITYLMKDEQLCRRLTKTAQKTITENGTYSWDEYAHQLLRLIRHDGKQHYTYVPELGMYGKWPIEERVKDLYPLLEKAKGLSVIDFGAAEGIVAREFLKKGAIRVHGFELDPYRVAVANAICSGSKDVEFRSADLSRWKTFYNTQKDLIEDQYDIVLYLGLHHHLPQTQRKDTFQNVLSLARQYIAIRTTQKAYVDDTIDDILADNGFEELNVKRHVHPDHLGVSKIFRRIEH